MAKFKYKNKQTNSFFLCIAVDILAVVPVPLNSMLLLVGGCQGIALWLLGCSGWLLGGYLMSQI